MKPDPQWIIPIDGSEIVGAHISINERGCVEIDFGDPQYGRTMTPLEAAQLSLALGDASRVAGEMRAKLDARRKR